MASLNRVVLMGNLTQDPQLKTLQSGTSVANFRLAMNRRYRTRQGEDREEACFVDIEVFGRQAEAVDQYLSKGSPALIEGRLRYDQWEDRESGEKRSKLVVRADQVQFISGGGGGKAAAGNTANEDFETYETGEQKESSAYDSGPADTQSNSAGDDQNQQSATEESDDDIPF